MLQKLKNFIKSQLGRYAANSKVIPKHIAGKLIIYALLAEDRTMVSKKRLQNLYRLCSNPKLPQGSFVECGVAKGGCLTLMSWISCGTRTVWGFDSFEGMPDLSEEDLQHGKNWVGYRCSGDSGKQAAIQTLVRFNAHGSWVNLIEGWFENTIPNQLINLAPIAILRLDSDWYKSTKFCLDTLYKLVAPGGVIIIDDYHTFLGCAKAVDEFREFTKITNSLITTENGSEVYWYK